VPRPSLRTRTVKRKNLRTPGARNIVHYDKISRPGDSRCSACGAVLSGVPRLTPSKMSDLAKSSKRPNRPYGGYLCPNCLASRIRAKVLGEDKTPQKARGKNR
jgi:large subunit ribosomal protein L34e